MRKHLALALFVLAASGCKKESKDAAKGDDEKTPPAKVTADAAPVAAKAPDAAPAVAVTADAAPAAAADPYAAKLDLLGTAAGCKDPDSLQRIWCIATDGWAKAEAAPLPAGATTLAGLSIELQDGKPADAALFDTTSVSALALKQDGGKQLAKLVNVQAQTREEKDMMFEAVAGLAIVYKGKADVAELPKDLAEYFASLADGADHEVTAAGVGWTWTGDSTAELRKVGDYWVTIEVPATHDGVWVSIFTDKIKAK